ncbi:MAG: GIY-YIG nuclease family protein [Bacteroidetes bacterium]|nr:GIY-YIG nuclease family protein [Bacteroidota bacterium]
MKCCYILFSEKLNRFYIGVCQDDLNERILKHNNHTYGNHRFTAKASDWILFFLIDCESYSQAVKIEKHIKAMKSRVYIRNLAKYPDISLQLLNKFKD